MPENSTGHLGILRALARKAMLEGGLLPDFSPEALAELDVIQRSAEGRRGTGPAPPLVRDLTGLSWASIDNDASRDLDQLTVAEALPQGLVKVLVAVAEVDGTVLRGSALDDHARHNGTSVYTPAMVFPMLPEPLSTGLTSLNASEERMAIVVEMVVGTDGSVQASELFRARVRNQAKLAYDGLAAWLEGQGELPPAAAAVPGLDQLLRLQDAVAERMQDFRHLHGALSLETPEATPVFVDDRIQGMKLEGRNRAKVIIENFMIAANVSTARYLGSKSFPSIRRVVRTPKRWERIVEIARDHGFELPGDPDSGALEVFLKRQKTVDPLRFPDLSVAVVKLLGPGEYVAQRPDEPHPGHFGLAVKDYAHSTAPNRRYSDLVTQRLLKAGLASRPCPYTPEELEDLARYCTEAEDAANKIERRVGKSAAALLLESKIGEEYEAIVTGASPKGTWVRLLTVAIEGRLVQGFQGLDVGARVRVRLAAVDVERGFIDLKRSSA